MNATCGRIPVREMRAGWLRTCGNARNKRSATAGAPGRTLKQLTRLAAASLLMVWLGTGCGSAYARECISIGGGLGTGPWKSPAIWGLSCGLSFPGASDNATISDGDTVRLDASLSVNSVTINGGGSLRFYAGDRTLTVIGAVTNNGNIQFDAAGTVVAKGDYTSTGTVTTAGLFGTVSFNGTTQQTVSGTGLGFYNVTMNNTNPTGNGISLGNNLTVNGMLKFTHGRIITGLNNKVTVGTAGSISRLNDDYTVDPPVLHGYVAGLLEKLFPAGDSEFTFHIGDADPYPYTYAPVTVSATGAPDPSDLTLSTTPGDHPNIDTSSLSPDFTVNRYWTIASSAVPGTYSATFNFPHSEIDMGAVPAHFRVQRYGLPLVDDKLAWHAVEINTDMGTATSTQATGLTAVGVFAIGEEKPKVKNEFIYLREIY